MNIFGRFDTNNQPKNEITIIKVMQLFHLRKYATVAQVRTMQTEYVVIAPNKHASNNTENL